MAYTELASQITGDNWTALEMNKYVKDNFAAGIPDIFTTKGDLAAASGANAAVRIPVGSNGDFLFADSGQTGGVTFGSPLALLMTGEDGANLACSSATDTLITNYSEERHDLGDAFASDIYTVPHAGYYVVYIHGNFYITYQDINDRVSIRLYKNDVLYSVLATTFCEVHNHATTINLNVAGMDIVDLVKGDTLKFYTNINIQTSDTWYLQGNIENYFNIFIAALI